MPIDPGELFSRYRDPVFRYLLRGTRDAAVAEELVGDTFVRIVGAVAGYTAQGRERAWVFRIAFGVLANWRRGRTRAPTPTTLAVEIGAEVGLPNARVDLDRALCTLDHDDREVLLLREMGGLDYAEIAELVGATHAAVRSRLHRARIAMRDAMDPPALVLLTKERRP